MSDPDRTKIVKGPGTVRWKVGQAIAWHAAGIREKNQEKKDGRKAQGGRSGSEPDQAH